MKEILLRFLLLKIGKRSLSEEMSSRNMCGNNVGKATKKCYIVPLMIYH